MTENFERFVESSDLPITLWDESSSCLRIPPSLSEVYRKVLQKYDLIKLRDRQDSKDALVGGISKTETEQHLAKRFDGSVARAQLALLDPFNQVAPAANGLIKSFSGNDICMTDSPCGSAAASLSILCTIAELRKQSVLPRIPLKVVFIGAEISDCARSFGIEFFQELKMSLEEQAISIDDQFYSWDVTDIVSNASLIQNMVRASAIGSKKLLIISNFSGFLNVPGKMKEAEKQLGDLFLHHSGPNNLGIWIEPCNNVTSSSGFFTRLTKAALKWARWFRFFTADNESDPLFTCKCKFECPINSSETHNVTLSVVRFELEQST